MENRVLYHKKFGKAEVTITKNTWKEALTALAGLGLLAFAIWYLTR